MREAPVLVERIWRVCDEKESGIKIRINNEMETALCETVKASADTPEWPRACAATMLEFRRSGRVGRVERAEMQHSPSRSTHPKVLRMQRDLVLGECLREDVRGHIFRGTVLELDSLVGDGLANEMKSNVDVLRPRVVVIVGGEAESGLIVAVEYGGSGKGSEKGLGESSEPNAFLRRVSCGDVLGLGGG